MATDAQDCRRCAARCIELAKQSRAPELRLVLMTLAKTWMKMALELERTMALEDDFKSPPKKNK